MKKKKPGKNADWWKRTWYFIWHDDSLTSWVINVILAFLIIKFIVYPGLGLLTGSTYPIVAVVSESMEHEQGFDEWWSDNRNFYLKMNITKDQFEFFKFHNGFNKGDIMILIGADAEKLEPGEIIVYQSRKPYPIIHRVVSKTQKANKYYFETKGDNNKHQIVDFDLDETNIPEELVYGKAVMRVPFLGYVKIWFVDFLSMIGYMIGF